MEVLSKTINYNLYQRGLFGNKLRSWDNLEDYRNDDYKGCVSIRYRGLIPGQFCYYNVNENEVEQIVDDIISKGGEKVRITINESAPDEFLTIQGELTRNECGLYLYYSTLKGKMRDCMKDAISTYGLQVKLMLQYYLTPSSYEDIMDLLDLYPEHVIEFSTYSKCLGDCKGRNTLIWEVRKY